MGNNKKIEMSTRNDKMPANNNKGTPYICVYFLQLSYKPCCLQTNKKKFRVKFFMLGKKNKEGTNLTNDFCEEMAQSNRSFRRI